MVEYLMKIMGLVLTSVVLINLLPTGRTSVLIKNIVRLCIYICILTPVFNFFLSIKGENKSSNFKIFTDYFSETVIPTDESYIKYCSEKSIENAERSIEKILLEDHQLNAEVSLQASIETSSYEIKIEKGFLKIFDFTSEENLQYICEELENKYSVQFEVIKGG